jgi:hypothetical protein
MGIQPDQPGKLELFWDVASKFVKHFQHSMSAAVSAVFLPGADEA